MSNNTIKTFKYIIFSQKTGNTLKFDSWQEAQQARTTIMNQECEELGWFKISSEVVLIDDTIAVCDVDENGTPIVIPFLGYDLL